MTGYRKILAAVDLSDDSALIRDRALMLATQHTAELHLVHVMEPIVPGYAMEVVSIDFVAIQRDAEAHARGKLRELGGSIGVPDERLHCMFGRPAPEIRALAETLGADLVVMGGHGKHGLELLLGSVSSGVTHGITCDLLIVRMPA
ncbi:MAG: universal stress protein [Pseudomonadota bacterium]|nr:universal stress protein [Pseudomonadota bacterium]